MSKRNAPSKRRPLWLIAAVAAVLVIALIVWQPWNGGNGPTRKIGGTLMSHAQENDSYYACTFGNRSYARNRVATITFLSSLSDKPNDAWDVSADQNGSVWAWVTPLNSAYELFIASDGIVALNEDCSGLFMGYSNLRRLSFNGNVDTSGVVQMGNMFNSCSRLQELDLSDFDTSSVQSMSFMFDDCSALISLDLSGFNTTHVESMFRMFKNCSGLWEVNLSGFDTSSVVDMRYMFSGCENLRELDLSSFNTGSVEEMNYMFEDCRNLTELNLSGFDTGKVRAMWAMFSGCKGLTKVDLSGFDTGKATSMRYMFSRCDSLTEIVVSNRFVIHSDQNPFENCPIQSLAECTVVD